jgi:RND superfamily putative drug exporter
VLLDTVLVRSLLVPAISYDLGRRIWWPSKLGRLADDERALATSRDEGTSLETDLEGASRG